MAKMSLDMIWAGARSAIETLYEDTCTVTAYEPVLGEDGITGMEETILLEGLPCRVSFSSIPNTTDSMKPTKAQAVKLFLSPDVTIPPGCRVDVTRYGQTTTYRSSGMPALYATHQEVNLVNYEETP